MKILVERSFPKDNLGTPGKDYSLCELFVAVSPTNYTYIGQAIHVSKWHERYPCIFFKKNDVAKLCRWL